MQAMYTLSTDSKMQTSSTALRPTKARITYQLHRKHPSILQLCHLTSHSVDNDHDIAQANSPPYLAADMPR
jgi:hypothetical protein